MFNCHPKNPDPPNGRVIATDGEMSKSQSTITVEPIQLMGLALFCGHFQFTRYSQERYNKHFPTVDGSELRRSPVEVGSFYPIIFKVSKTSHVVQPRLISPQHQTVSCGSLGTLSVAGLRPIGMFGTRLNGRDVHASARYINTKLSPFLGALEMLVGAFGWCLKLQPPSPEKKKKNMK